MKYLSAFGLTAAMLFGASGFSAPDNVKVNDLRLVEEQAPPTPGPEARIRGTGFRIGGAVRAGWGRYGYGYGRYGYGRYGYGRYYGRYGYGGGYYRGCWRHGVWYSRCYYSNTPESSESVDSLPAPQVPDNQ
jgi:hypothetical protein